MNAMAKPGWIMLRLGILAVRWGGLPLSMLSGLGQ